MLGILLLVCLLLHLVLNGVVVLLVLLPDVLLPLFLSLLRPFVPVAGPPVVAPHVPGPAAPAVDVNSDLLLFGQAVSRADSLRYLQTIVKDHIFPRIKFPDPDEDLLSFSNDPQSICRQMATLAGVTDVDIEAWWNLTRKGVFKTIKQLRKNAIRLLGNAIKGNFVVSCCCSLRLHTVFSNTNFPSPPQQNMY